MKQRFSTEFLLQKTGGFFILLVIVIAQLLAFPGVILGMISVQLSAAFSQNQFQLMTGMLPVLILTVNLILLVIIWIITPNARKRLSLFAGGGAARTTSDLEFKAWKEITGLTLNYGIMAAPIFYLGTILPPGLSNYWNGAISQQQFNYTLLGGIVAITGAVFLQILLIDAFITPARLALIPADFALQISGRRGALLSGKLVPIISALVLIAILMIAPIGFRYTSMAMGRNDSPSNILSNLQFQSNLAGLLALLFGFFVAYFISRTITNPLRELIDTFKNIEQGDLTRRARITTTDEIAELAIHFNHMVAQLEELHSDLEQQVYKQTAQLKATNEIGSAASSILEPDELLKKVVNLITDRFGHYYAAIYLVDHTGHWAELIEGTGDAGKVLKQNKHRLELAEKGLITDAINNHHAMIADSQNASLGSANLLLPYTKSEIALPLSIGDHSLGALDVHSTHDGAFNPQDIDTLQGMANQVSIALENARLYQEAQRNLGEMQSIQKQYLYEAWSNMPDEEQLTYSLGDSIDDGANKIEAPLTLRDQRLGLIKLATDEDLTSEEQNLINAVASQAAIALENARLVNESRQLADRERLVADISNKIWTSTTVDGVLQTIVKELGRALDTTHAVIELKSDENNE